MPSEPALLSVVVPVYRSEAYLADTVADLIRGLQPAGPFEIVLVNDASPDHVQEVIDRLCATDPRIRQVCLARNVGQHRATLRGFAATRGDVVVTLDDDGQNPPAAALTVAGALGPDVDVVYGRFQQVEQSWSRRIASRLNRWLSRLTLANRGGISITNVRALRGDLARWIASTPSSYPYIDALVFGATHRVVEVEVEHRARARGTSTYGLGKLISLWVSHLTSLTILPLRLAVVGSFGVSFLGFALGVGMMIRALWAGGAPEGWLSLFCVVTFLFSVLFAFLGIVSAYVGRMYVGMNERGLAWERPGGATADGPRPDGPSARG